MQTKNNKRSLLVTGPCSAESKEQLFDIASTLQQRGLVDVFRAGVWKPRTSPYAFEGRGEEALEWLEQIQQQLTLPVATEVATPLHVEQCLQHSIHTLWIGARTTVNPFLVQEIVNALQGVKGVRLLIKNPVNPDLNLWIGAFERAEKAGITDVWAVHRGFSSLEAFPYRNAPLWELPIEIKLRCPQLPILCDPSHLTGNAELIPEVVQKAIDMEMQGLMIEVHTAPEKALSDNMQQLTPEALQQLLEKVRWRKTYQSSNQPSPLDMYRQLIDETDDQLLSLLAKRFRTVEQIATFKQQENLTILQIDRWSQVKERMQERAKQLQISSDFVERLCNLIHEEAIRIQNGIMNRNTERND